MEFTEIVYRQNAQGQIDKSTVQCRECGLIQLFPALDKITKPENRGNLEKISNDIKRANQNHDIRTIKSNQEGVLVSDFKCPHCGTVLSVSVKAQESKAKSLEEIKGLFVPELRESLNFEQTNDYMIIRPRHYLGSENFAKIAAVVRGAGGEYISAGKDSHFKIPLRP